MGGAPKLGDLFFLHTLIQLVSPYDILNLCLLYLYPHTTLI